MTSINVDAEGLQPAFRLPDASACIILQTCALDGTRIETSYDLYRGLIERLSPTFFSSVVSCADTQSESSPSNQQAIGSTIRRRDYVVKAELGIAKEEFDALRWPRTSCTTRSSRSLLCPTHTADEHTRICETQNYLHSIVLDATRVVRHHLRSEMQLSEHARCGVREAGGSRLSQAGPACAPG